MCDFTRMSTTIKTMPNCWALSGLSFPLLKLRIFPGGDPQRRSPHSPTRFYENFLAGALRAPRTYIFSLPKKENRDVFNAKSENSSDLAFKKFYQNEMSENATARNVFS